MACLALLGEVGGSMPRIGGGIVIFQMATYALFVGSCITGTVAFNTIHGDVTSFQWECRGSIMVKCRWCPAVFGMACLALLGEVGRGMPRIGGGVVIFQVATYALFVGSHITGTVAFDTIHADMATFQWECRGSIMVKCRWHPTIFGMACLALLGEVGGSMPRIGGGVVIFQVATYALFIGSYKTGTVAFDTIHADMATL